MKFSISLLIAAYNEESTISPLVQDNFLTLNNYVQTNKLTDFEIVVLNDGSSDGTDNELKAFATNPKVRIITNKKPSGIVKSFNQLYANIDHDWYMLIPGDGQWNSESTKLMIDKLLSCDVPTGINGVRNNKKEVYNSYRFILSELYCKFSDYLLKSHGSDPGSIKLLPKSFSTMPMKSGGLIQQIELLYAAKTRLPGGLKLVPVPWTSRIAGEQSGAKIGLVLVTGFWFMKALFLRF